jgi:hypothetical protein
MVRFFHKILDALVPFMDWLSTPKPKIVLTAQEIDALAFAWMNLIETARRGREKGCGELTIGPVNRAAETIAALLKKAGRGWG